MKTIFNLTENLRVTKEIKGDSHFRLIEYSELLGIDDFEVNKNLRFMKRKLKQVRIALNDSTVKIKEEKISYYKGVIDEIGDLRTNRASFTKRLFSDLDDGYDDVYPSYTGQGEIFSTLVFDDFIFLELESEEVLIKEDIFYACEGDIQTEFEGDDEILLMGEGIVVLDVSIPEQEIIRCSLNKDSIGIFDDEVILKRGCLDKRVGKNNTLYVGSGEIWIIPTKRVYEDLKYRLTDCE